MWHCFRVKIVQLQSPLYLSRKLSTAKHKYHYNVLMAVRGVTPQDMGMMHTSQKKVQAFTSIERENSPDWGSPVSTWFRKGLPMPLSALTLPGTRGNTLLPRVLQISVSGIETSLGGWWRKGWNISMITSTREQGCKNFPRALPTNTMKQSRTWGPCKSDTDQLQRHRLQAQSKVQEHDHSNWLKALLHVPLLLTHDNSFPGCPSS